MKTLSLVERTTMQCSSAERQKTQLCGCISSIFFLQLKKNVFNLFHIFTYIWGVSFTPELWRSLKIQIYYLGNYSINSEWSPPTKIYWFGGTTFLFLFFSHKTCIALARHLTCVSVFASVKSQTWMSYTLMSICS